MDNMYHGETEKSSNNLYYTQLSHGPFPVLLLHAFALPKQLQNILKMLQGLGMIGTSQTLTGILQIEFNQCAFTLWARFASRCAPVA